MAKFILRLLLVMVVCQFRIKGMLMLLPPLHRGYIWRYLATLTWLEMHFSFLRSPESNKKSRNLPLTFNFFEFNYIAQKYSPKPRMYCDSVFIIMTLLC